MIFSKVKLTSISLLLTSFVCFFSFANTEEDTTLERVPTEELIEGIKSSDGRWFEVEMIIFDRKDTKDIREQFDSKVKSLEPKNNWDLIRDALQPDISLQLNKLEQCHQDKNPLNPDSVEALSPEEFFDQMQAFQTLINNAWQFTNELCLLPNEELSGYWHFVNELPDITKQDLSQVPLESIPTVITGGDHDDFHNVYLIAEQNLQLKEQFYRLKKHPNLNPILHLGWRQPGLSKRRAKPVYIVAGKNLSKQFRYDGSEIITPPKQEIDISDYLSPDLFNLDSKNINDNQQLAANDLMEMQQQNNLTKFMQKLESGAVVDFQNNTLIYPEQNELPPQTWTLDGHVTVHLNHYLFVNAEFNYREQKTEQVDPTELLKVDEGLLPEIESEEENNDLTHSLGPITQVINTNSILNDDNIQQSELITMNYLKNYYFKQTRRFYSGDLHYLDHPKFGILIQIRKYRH